MKTTIIAIATLSIAGLSYTAFNLNSTNSQLEQQLQAALNYQTILEADSEVSTRQRLELESRIAELQSELLENSTRLTSLSAALTEAEQRANPEYEALLEQARREVAARTQQPRQGGAGSAFAMFSNPDMTLRLAEDRIGSSFSAYLEGLGLSSSETEGLYQALVDFNNGRYQMLGELMSGNLTTDQAADIFGPDALMESFSDLLSPEEAAELENFNLSVNQDAARQVYSNGLANGGDAISGETRDRVMDVLLEELFSQENNYGALVAGDGSMTTAYNDKVDAFDRTRSRLEGELNAAQLSQFDSFVDSQLGSVDLILEANQNAEGGIEVRNMKVSTDNLPN